MQENAATVDRELGKITTLRARIAALEAENAALRAAYEDSFYHATFDQAAVGIAHVALDGSWLRVNARLCAMLGYTEAELRARTFQDITHPDDLEVDLGHVRRLLVGEITTYSMEKRYIRKDGALLWGNLTVSLLLDASGVPRNFISIIEDISARTQVEEALRRSQSERERQRRLYEAVLGSTPDLAYVFDLQHRFIYANKGLLRMWGRTWEEAIGKTCLELGYEPWHAAMHDREIEQVIATQQPIRGEVPFTGTFGRRIYDYIFTPVLGPDGRVEAVAGTTRDVTEYKRIEESLADSEARLRAAILAAPFPIVLHAEDGEILELSRKWMELTGYTRDELRTHFDWGRLAYPETYSRFESAIRREHAQGGEIAAGERTIRTKDGSVRVWDFYTTSAGQLPGGRRLRISAAVDVTERTRAETALRASETRLRDLLAILELASVFIRDIDGTIRFWSKGCERLYGWTAEEANGCVCHDLLATVFPTPLEEIEATLRRDGQWSGDLVQRRRDGTMITVAARKVLRRSAAGQPEALMESVTDVTELRQAQAALRGLNEDLEGRVRAEVGAREAAQARLAQAEKLTALGQLAGGVAHDFNNVMQAVLGGASLIRHRADDPETVRRLGRMVEDAAQRGTAITHRLLAFARRDELRAEPLDVITLLDGIREVLTHTLGANITVQVDAAARLSPVLADRSQLETALVNLATNARDAMPGGGTITLSAMAESVTNGEHSEGLSPGDYVRIAVADTGTGIEPALLTRVMEPFFTTKETGKGTGLGLSTARSFAAQSGGALALASIPGQGTTVTLWLPVAEAAPAGAVALEEGVATPSDVAASRILLVDDEPLVREVLAVQLAEQGYDMVQAENGATALELLGAGEMVDLLITDLSMPGMDGIALIREAQRRRPHLPAILLTGYAGGAEAIAGDDAVSGAFSLLHKPVSGAHLADRVATLLEATAGQRG